MGVAQAQTGTATQATITSGGVTRTYTIYVPTSYNASTPVPLVVNMHGYAGNDQQQMEYGDFRRIADTANFIVVQPRGLLNQVTLANAYTWVTDKSVDEGAADRAFILNLVNEIKANYSINANKVYCTGFSLGGFMSFDMACFNNNTFAAVAGVAGTAVQSHYDACAPNGSTPVMQIHGTKDDNIGYNGVPNVAFSPASIDVEEYVNYWVNYNKCSTTPTTTTLVNSDTTDSCTVEHRVYTGGTNGATVEAYKVINGGHAWPADTTTGGLTGTAGALSVSMTQGFRNGDFNASKEIWRFFSQHSLSTRTGIDEEAPVVDLHLYPNPSNGVITVSVDDYSNTSVTVYNAVGVAVFTSQLSANVTTLALDVPSGMYFCQAVNNTTGATVTNKITVK